MEVIEGCPNVLSYAFYNSAFGQIYEKPMIYCDKSLIYLSSGLIENMKISQFKEYVEVILDLVDYNNTPRQVRAMLLIFMTYRQNESFSETSQYLDEFLNQGELKWYTKPNHTMISKQEHLGTVNVVKESVAEEKCQMDVFRIRHAVKRGYLIDSQQKGTMHE